MVWYFVLWGSVILIGILFIMSGYDKASDEEKDKKKKNAKTFVIAIVIILILGWLGVFKGCESDNYNDDPSEWIRHT